MKTLEVVVALVTGVLLFTTVVCGLWLQFSGEEITDSNRTFHMVVGLMTAASGVVTLVLMLIG
jgi:hypothetical protein